jgi:TonB family protein
MSAAKVLSFFLMICICSMSLKATGQPTDESCKIFTKPEEMPQFLGGDSVMNRFINSVMHYPKKALEFGVQGTVTTTFVVDTDGTLHDIKLMKGGLGANCEDEALRIIAMMPKWKAGRMHGKTVKVQVQVPVVFDLKSSGQQATKNSTTSNALQGSYDAGVDWLQKGDFQPAIQEFNNALIYNPVDADAYYNRGVASFKMQDTLQACKDWSMVALLGDTTVFQLLRKNCGGMIRTNSSSYSVDDSNVQETNRVYNFIEEMPKFPGGDVELMHFLQSHVKYPEDAKKKNSQGKVYVTFTINRLGEVTNPMILRSEYARKSSSEDASLEMEALRVVALMPNWIPGKLNGIPVNVQYNLPIIFTLR